ncbi:MAG: SDR family oxidoreductase [Oscillospiraceae bacterium]|nr:SDR family oxidoreductase [Oscillospiraceae bacterium]
MRLQDKVILVTASTRGIGLAVVKKCAREGAKVYMAARDLERAQEIVNTLHGVKCVYNDATKPETFLSMVEDVVTDAGRLDVLVNNFGTSNPGKDLDFANTDPQIFLDTVNLNLRSVFMASQAAAKHMANHGGSIINISSVGGLVPDISQIAYGTSKAAINYLTKLIAVQEAKHHIRCNAVLPGMTATEAVEKHLSDDFRNLFLRHIPLGRMGLPEEIAEAVCYFAGDASAYTTGQILTVSGGFGLATPVYGDLANQDSKR